MQANYCRLNARPVLEIGNYRVANFLRKSNATKHGVAFERAATVFRDPNALSVFDEEHSDEEERWLTLGIDGNGTLLVVHHTFTNLDKEKHFLCTQGEQA